GPALEANDEWLSAVEEYIAGLGSGEIKVWTGPINLQDGTEDVPAGEVATDPQVWYAPQILEGMTGASEERASTIEPMAERAAEQAALSCPDGTHNGHLALATESAIVLRGELREIRRYFGTVRASDGISLVFEPGRIYGLLGENGAGKSTLIKILSGYQAPTSGDILLDGEPVTFTSPSDALSQGIG